MTKFYGESTPFSTAATENYSKFANDFLKIGLYPLYHQGDATLVIRGKTLNHKSHLTKS